MRFTVAAVFAVLSSFALSQSLPGLPTCAQTCFGNNYGGCSVADVKCICSNSELISNLSCCVSQKCNQADQETTIDFAKGICIGQGVTVPSKATCASSAASTSAPTSSASGSGTASGTATVTSAASSAAAQSGSSSTGAAVPMATAGPLGMGIVMAGFLAAI